MIVVVIIGILAAIAIPNFVSYMHKTKANEAMLQLNALAKRAKTYYQTNTEFPQGSAAVLPGPDGGVCATAARKFPRVSWTSDPMWTALDFQIDDEALFSYHYDSTDKTHAKALAVGDLDCDKKLITYTLDLTVPAGEPAFEIISPPANSD